MTTIYTNDPELQQKCIEYCETRSYFWNMFFGWRGTDAFDYMTFKIPKGAFFRICEEA